MSSHRRSGIVGPQHACTDGTPTAEELARRIRSNIMRLKFMGEDCPIKYLIQLREDLELLEKYEAAHLIPPEVEEMAFQVR